MQNAVLVTFDHAVSTDENPQHGRCPVGRESTCHRAAAWSTSCECAHTHLSADVARHVKPVYARLAHDDLLSRCLLGKTQNVNESLHSKVWTKCPKTNFVGLERVLSATCSSVAEFNCGVESSMRYLCEVMQVPSGAHLLSSVQKSDRQRLRQAKRQKVAATKEARRSRRFARRAVASASTDYATGAF